MREPTAAEQMIDEDARAGVDVHAYWGRSPSTPPKPEQPPWRPPAPPWSPFYVAPADDIDPDTEFDPPAPAVLASDDDSDD